MHPENSFYGHRFVLGDAIGSSDGDPRFIAHIQHGWAPFSPVGHPERLLARLPYLAWSERTAATVRSQGVRNVRSIGAPFLYLLRRRGLEISAKDCRPGDRSMLVYPAHGWEREKMDGNHAQFIAELTERAEGPVTICLYWVEFRQAKIRRVYEEAGFRVISHGLRGDPGFLWRQLDEMLRNDIVVSNHVSTALWYGGVLARGISRIGPAFSIYGSDYQAKWSAYQASRWPDLESGLVDAGAASEMARWELGADSLLTPEELSEALGIVEDEAISRRRVRRASTLAAFTARRVVAVARSRVFPGRIVERDRQMMAAEVDA